MKKTKLRICAAFFLVGMGLAASVGILGGLSEEKESQTRILFVTQPGARVVRLYAGEGEAMEVLRTNAAGEVVSPLLKPGIYFAATARSFTSFALEDGTGLRVLSGSGEAVGRQLRLGERERGQITVERIADAELLAQDGWVEYVLKNETTQLQEVLRSCAPGEALRCDFEDVPYGTYALLENGNTRCHVTVSKEQPTLYVSLP